MIRKFNKDDFKKWSHLYKAQKLINHLKSLSKSNNWDGIRWITHSSNENAKKLYNKIANNTGFELYELK